MTAAGVEPANTGAGPAPAWQHKPSIPGQQSVADQRSAQDGRRTPAAAPLPRQSGGYQGVSFRGVGPRGYHRSAERIYEDICDRLTENPFIDASDVEVTVSGGEVVLSGSIDSAISTYQVESIAREAPGVAVVRNNLSVRYGEETSVPAAGAGIDPTPEETRR
ncbi:MAG TPA: BON domain-containing protein [Stellaceae bacterium]|nr:BON domain-containing protein [Stellaceae bacterium]